VKLNNWELASIGIIVLMAIAGAALYPQLPENMASHWNSQGQVDDYAAKSFVLPLIPALTLLLFICLQVLPYFDPLRKNYAAFGKQFGQFKLVFVAFMAYVYGLVLAYNLAGAFDFGRALVPAFAVLFYSAGELMKHTKRNWFVGIRTPWALSSDKVWKKTHELGGALFQAGAIVALVGALLFEGVVVWVILALAIAAAIAPVILSYVWYREEQRKRK